MNYSNLISKFSFRNIKTVFFDGFLFIFLSLSFLPIIALAKSDSSSVSPPSNLTPQFSSTISAPPAVTSERYDQLPICPTSIGACADINDKGGNATTCPDYCTVTRIPNIVVPNTPTRITVSKAAICPNGYAQVGVYNMQTELIYNETPAAIYPVENKFKYTTYVFSGYSCVTTGARQTSDDYCHSAPYSYNNVVDDVNNASPYNAVVRIGDPNTGETSYRSRCSCKGSCLTCSCDVASDDVWRYYYFYIKCTPPPGVYATGNLAPASVVCARTKSTWRSVN